jgi:hypothetical protein
MCNLSLAHSLLASRYAFTTAITMAVNALTLNVHLDTLPRLRTTSRRCKYRVYRCLQINSTGSENSYTALILQLNTSKTVKEAGNL